MTEKRISFSGVEVKYVFNGSNRDLSRFCDRNTTAVITDENVFQAQPRYFKGWNTIVLKPGEQYKVQQTADAIIDQLIDMEADRDWTLAGIGGGVVTDITGYTAAIYMRGIRCGFVPSSLLAMVDAAIGGKNGVDVGPYKNLTGTIRQPAFLLYDTSLLSSLPESEWSNGFAECIKHACIRDAAAFKLLKQAGPLGIRRNRQMLSDLIERNAMLKSRIVRADEREQGERKLLNFGHTLGHALETTYALSHGQAVALGMVYAARISEKLKGFQKQEEVKDLIASYGLPTELRFDPEKVMRILRMDKKRSGKGISYILLERIGKACIERISLRDLEELIRGLAT